MYCRLVYTHRMLQNVRCMQEVEYVERNHVRLSVYTIIMICVSIFIMMQWGEWAETQSNLQMCLNNPLTDSNLVK